MSIKIRKGAFIVFKTIKQPLVYAYILKTENEKVFYLSDKLTRWETTKDAMSEAVRIEMKDFIKQIEFLVNKHNITTNYGLIKKALKHAKKNPECSLNSLVNILKNK